MPVIEKKINGGFEGFKKRLDSLKGDWTEIGWFPGNRYPSYEESKNNKKSKKNKPKKTGSGIPVAQVAIIQEFGSPENNIPPRSFLRSSLKENNKKIISLIISGSKGVLNGKESFYSLSSGIGLSVSGMIRKKITQITEPPLKQDTIDARTRRYSNKKKSASDKPLVDTGLMLATLTYTVSLNKK